MSLSFREFAGTEIAGVVDDLARLRVTVFRDWPYLYDGDAEYERRYLERTTPRATASWWRPMPATPWWARPRACRWPITPMISRPPSRARGST
jgi:hypothetical protein